MGRPWAADEGGLLGWTKAADVLNKQSRTTENWVILHVEGLSDGKQSFIVKVYDVTKCCTALRLHRFLSSSVLNLRIL